MPEIRLEHITKRWGKFYAVEDLNLVIADNAFVTLLGPSGCGKSTLGRTILRLIEPTSGEILYNGQNIAAYNTRQMLSIRKEMQIIFQDPYASLDPRMRVAQIIAEPLITHNLVQGKADCEKRVDELLEAVGLPVDCRKK